MQISFFTSLNKYTDKSCDVTGLDDDATNSNFTSPLDCTTMIVREQCFSKEQVSPEQIMSGMSVCDCFSWRDG